MSERPVVTIAPSVAVVRLDPRTRYDVLVDGRVAGHALPKATAATVADWLRAAWPELAARAVGGQPTYVLADHVCRHCGGRVLRQATGTGPTPGGNPVFRCAQCGAQTCGMGPGDLCWCGNIHRGQTEAAYLCLPFAVLDERPELREAFLACGCDPAGQAEVGIVLARDLRRRSEGGA